MHLNLFKDKWVQILIICEPLVKQVLLQTQNSKLFLYKYNPYSEEGIRFNIYKVIFVLYFMRFFMLQRISENEAYFCRYFHSITETKTYG